MINRGGVIMLLMINAFTLFGQDNAYCIYKSAEDYKNRMLFCEIATASAGKIKLHHFFSGKYVDIIKDGKRYRFCKDSIFGYRNSKNEDFRFYKTYDEEYKIVESGNIIVYSYPIILRANNGRYIRTEQRYFFSKTADSPVLPLTVLNLKRAFPENIKFHDMLDLQFGKEEYLSEGDISKVNELLIQSNK